MPENHETWHGFMTLAPTCCGIFSVRFAKVHTLKINKVILEQVLSRYKSETQLLLKPWAFYLPITCRHASPFLFARRCRAGGTKCPKSDPALNP